MPKIFFEITMDGNAFDLMVKPDEISANGNAVYRIVSEKSCNDALPYTAALMLIRDMERTRTAKGKMNENDKTPSL